MAKKLKIHDLFHFDVLANAQLYSTVEWSVATGGDSSNVAGNKIKNQEGSQLITGIGQEQSIARDRIYKFFSRQYSCYRRWFYHSLVQM